MKRGGFLKRRTPLKAKVGLKRGTVRLKKGGRIKSKTTLRKQLDAVFSRYIRYRDGGQCYTCPHKDDPKRMQCGHFVPRQYLAVRYDETNCNTQCYACNMLYNGQPSRYAMNLERDHGRGIVEKLEAQRQVITKDFPYEALLITYTEKLAQIQL